MAIPDNAVLRKARNVKAGDTVCFSHAAYNFVVDSIDTRDEPFPQVRLKHGNDEHLTTTYDPNESLYVTRP